jgi:hypothetical protein
MLDHADVMSDAIIAAILAVLGAVVWFVRLEGRVSLLDRILSDHLRDSKEAFSAFASSLKRVEEKIDKLTMKCIATRAHTHWREGDKVQDEDRDESHG